MPKPTRIPLFPLDVVLLPAMPLPLHIFEPRYKAMVSRCLNEKLEFGMILAANKAVATAGCTAEIVKTIRDYPDGRTDVLVEGRAIFRLTELLDEREYYEGLVEYVTDEPAMLDLTKESQLIRAFEQCHELLFGQPWLGKDPGEPATLAYRMAALLPLELEKRQALLETRSEGQRRDTLAGWIETLLPKLAEARRARERHTRN
ncbi:MAG: LON peptidase substrate-binding domain-containing protein [Candidatus Acidiferrales bacterium]|jgi:Lon protease-like protein